MGMGKSHWITSFFKQFADDSIVHALQSIGEKNLIWKKVLIAIKSSCVSCIRNRRNQPQ